MVDVDPVGLVRGRPGSKGNDFSLAQYVNDRPYVTSSFTSVVLGKMFSTAMTGRSNERPELAAKAINLEVRLPVTPCRGGVDVATRLFEPLGYTVVAEEIPLDPKFPEWGMSRYLDLALSTTETLKSVLEQLFVLLPVLDDDKHYPSLFTPPFDLTSARPRKGPPSRGNCWCSKPQSPTRRALPK